MKTLQLFLFPSKPCFPLLEFFPVECSVRFYLERVKNCQVSLMIPCPLSKIITNYDIHVIFITIILMN